MIAITPITTTTTTQTTPVYPPMPQELIPLPGPEMGNPGIVPPWLQNVGANAYIPDDGWPHNRDGW